MNSNKEINEIIEILINKASYFISKIRSGDISNAMNNFFEMTFFIQELTEIINSTDSLIDYGNEINLILKNILDSMENRDYYLMSDIIEYELIQVLNNLKINN